MCSNVMIFAAASVVVELQTTLILNFTFITFAHGRFAA